LSVIVVWKGGKWIYGKMSKFYEPSFDESELKN